MLVLDFPIDKLRPASYNPRQIAPDALEKLKESISTLGFAKPVIVTSDGLLVAGHQRTKAAGSLGLKVIPAWVLASVTGSDEIRFNQLHNGTDMDLISSSVSVPACDALGTFVDVSPADIAGDLRDVGATIRHEISNLILRYGRWGCAVATKSGQVISSPQYALACNLLGEPCRVFYVPDGQREVAAGFFTHTYGQFNYDHLPRETYIQSFAQMHRLRGTGRDNLSPMYENWILPNIKEGERILDFGCGQGDYVASLKKRGVHIHGIEFFRRKRGENVLDRTAVHDMIRGALSDWETHGGFDVVLADSVLNSVDSVQAERDVLTCLSAFCRMGGRVYVSGRSRSFVDKMVYRTRCAQKIGGKRETEFLDSNGFSGIFRKGQWFYQKFHVAEQVVAMHGEFFGGKDLRYEMEELLWRSCSIKDKEIGTAEVAVSFEREFDLPWPNGERVGMGNEAVDALMKVRACA